MPRRMTTWWLLLHKGHMQPAGWVQAEPVCMLGPAFDRALPARPHARLRAPQAALSAVTHERDGLAAGVEERDGQVRMYGC